MDNDGLEQNRIVARLPKILLVLLLPTLLLIFLLCGLSRGVRARPTRQTGENLVPNPGFEQPSPAFWFNSGSHKWLWWYFWSGSESHGGDHSAGIGNNVKGYKGQWWSDLFAVEAGRQYYFSGWIRSEDLSDHAFLTLAFYSSPSQDRPIAEFYSSRVAGSSDWIEVTGNAVAPSNYARLFCELRGQGTVWFDDIFAGLAITETPIPVINKSDYPDPVEPGQSLIYTITYSNMGSVNATQVVITDTYDVNVSFDSADPAPEPGSDNRVWEIGTLGPQGSGFIVITVTVNSPLNDGLILQNWVEMDCNETDSVSDTTTTRVTSLPDLVISKSENLDPVDPGSTLVYTIIYSNIGTAVATGVDITDTLPISVSYESASVTPTTFVSATNTLIWENLGDLDVGANSAVIVTVTVSSSARKGSSLLNQVKIDCDEDVLEEAEEYTMIRPDLISIAPEYASSIVLPGQEACYAHTIYLTGAQSHTLSVTAVSSHGWATNVSTPSVPLQPGDLEEMQACVSVPAGCTTMGGTVDTLTVTVSLIGSPGDMVMARDTTTVDRVLSEIPVTPVRSSVANCSGQYPQGFTFAHHITNTGNYTDQFELDIAYHNCSSEMVQVVPTSQVVTPCQSFTATVFVTATQAEPGCSVIGTVASQSFPQIYTLFSDEVEPLRAWPLIEPEIAKTADISSIVTFTHVITNGGNCTDIITVSPSSSHGWDIEWGSPGSLAPGDSAEIVVSVTVPCVMSGTVDTVVITATSSLDPSKKNTAVDAIKVETNAVEPDLGISKSGYPDPVEPGQSLVYTIAYSNTGHICSATQVAITETYDVNVSFDSANPDPSRDNYVWEISALGPQKSGFIVITVTVNSPLTNGLILWNTVEMDCDHTDAISYTTKTEVNSPIEVYLPLVLRNYPPPPPAPEGNVVIEGGDATVYHRYVTLTLSASVEGDTVVEMRLRNDGEGWSTWEPYTTSPTIRSWMLADGISGLRTVDAQFRGSKGGISEPVSDQTYLLWNGGFETGDFTRWTHGGELDQSVECEGHQCYAVLGNPDYPCDGGVPVGEAWMEQTLSVPSCSIPTLSFKYNIFSQDKLVSWSDSFDVYINSTQILTDGNKSGEESCDIPPWNSGWTDFSYALSAYRGQNIQASFHNVSRYDNWYNTWTYVDQIEVACKLQVNYVRRRRR